MNFAANNYAIAYKMFCNFMKSYYGREDTQMVDRNTYKSQCPLIVFDCSRNESLLKSSAIDVRIDCEFHEALPANTIGCCLVIHKKVVRYNPFTNIIEHIM